MIQPTLAIFDLDGTLIDSAGDLRHAVNRLLADHGCAPLSLDEVRRMVGDGASLLITRAFIARECANTDPAGALNIFLRYYEAAPVVETTPYPGVIEALEALRDRDIKLAICTNKPYALAKIILEKLGLARYFVRVVGGDSFPFRKPDPRMLAQMLTDMSTAADAAVLIGDSEVDAATAKAAGVPFVLMTYGYRRGSASEISAIASLGHFSELIRVIGALR